MSKGIKKTLTIKAAKESKKAGWFIVDDTDGNTYGTSEIGITSFIGKTAEFDTGQAGDKLYINKPLPAVPLESTPISPSGGGGYKDSTITAKNTMLMQAIELIKHYNGEFKTSEDALKFIESTFEAWQAMYSPKVQIRPSEKPSEYISKVLNELGKRGWTEKDLLDHMFNEVDIQLKYDKATEKIVWDNVPVDTLKKIMEELDKVPF